MSSSQRDTEMPTDRQAQFEERVNAKIANFEAQLNQRSEALKAVSQFHGSGAEAEKSEEGCCWRVVKIVQYLFGFTIGIYSLFITFYGLIFSHSKSSPDVYFGTDQGGPLHPALVIILVLLLLTILAFCEGTQIALMLLEKVSRADLVDKPWMCSDRVRRTHDLAQNNPEGYLVGRQIFVTGIVFLIAKTIHMKPTFAPAVEAELGWLGNPYLIGIFVHTGLAGSLIVLAFGQLLPQLIVTTTPILQYQLFPTYELIWIQLFCERMGVAEMANILRKFTRWVFDLTDEAFGVGSGVEFSAKDDNKEEAQTKELSGCVTFWMSTPMWWQVCKVIIGIAVFFASIFSICYNIISGSSDFTKWAKDADGAIIRDANGNPTALPGDIDIWIQLLIFVPLSNIAMGFLEGSQIAILALEKAPGRTVKRVHRDAYFGHKLSQQRDNVRRYLLGRQFLVVFVDFIAAHSMGMGGLGILVPVSQLYPQLLAATNPMWFLGTWGSKAILLLALLMEFCGFCHFSWGLFTIFMVIRNLVKDQDDAEGFAVGKTVDITGDDDLLVASQVDDVGELQRIIVEQQQKISTLESILKKDDGGN